MGEACACHLSGSLLLCCSDRQSQISAQMAKFLMPFQVGIQIKGVEEPGQVGSGNEGSLGAAPLSLSSTMHMGHCLELGLPRLWLRKPF